MQRGESLKTLKEMFIGDNDISEKISVSFLWMEQNMFQ